MIRDFRNGAGFVELSLDEYARAHTGEFTHPDNVGPFKTTTRPDREMGEWFGGLQTRQQAYDLFTRGWSDGARKIERNTADVEIPTLKSRKRVLTRRDDGDELILDAALRGDWDNAWRTTHRAWTPGVSHVTLYGQMGGNCTRSADEMFWSGAALLVAADRLEAAGYPVRVIGSRVLVGADIRTPARVDVVLKESGDPIQMDALASVLCHAGVFRTMGFESMCAVPVALGDFLGFPRSFESQQAAFKAADMWPDDAIVVDDAYDPESAVRAIRKAMDVVITGYQD